MEQLDLFDDEEMTSLEIAEMLEYEARQGQVSHFASQKAVNRIRELHSLKKALVDAVKLANTLIENPIDEVTTYIQNTLDWANEL